MNTDWLRAWRYLHKYTLGVALAFAVYAVLRGRDVLTDLGRALPLLSKGDTNTIFVLAAIFLTMVLCATFLDLLYHLVALTSSLMWAIITRVAPARSSATTNWMATLMMPAPELFRRSVSRHQHLVSEFIYLISVSGALHEQAFKLSKEAKDYFTRALALVRDKSPDEVWYLTYALQVTQDRREIDSLHTEQVLALGYASVGALLWFWTLDVQATLSMALTATLFAVGAISFVAAIRYAVESKRKRVMHLIALFIQQFSWGEFAEVQDREAG